MAFLVSGQSVTGTGSAQGFASLDGRWSDRGYVMLECSGNSASASVWCSPDAANVGDWLLVTAWALGVNATATAQLTSYYPTVAAQVDWISGGARTALVNLQVVLRKMTNFA